MKQILLVEPEYYTRYPPLGLLKLATHHRNKGDRVQLVRGTENINTSPHKIYITSLFTWQWKPVWAAVRYYKKQFPKSEVVLGGIYASLLKDHAEMSGADLVWEGIYNEVEYEDPAYDLVPEWESSVLFATRGCPRKCGFCSVPKLEGPPVALGRTIKSRLYDGHKKAVFFDNNVLGLPESEDILMELAELGITTDFNQGMDVRYIDDRKAELISQVKFSTIRMAFDYSGIRPWVEKGIISLKEHGIRGRNQVFYVLYNYVDSPEDFFKRIRDLMEWGVVAYPMRYEPLTTLKKGQYIAPNWDVEQIKMVEKARRVLGFGGAFPPYKGLVKKITEAANFEDAFTLDPPKTTPNPPRPIVEMAYEHEHQDSINKNYFPKWRRELDWRKVSAQKNSSAGK